MNIQEVLEHPILQTKDCLIPPLPDGYISSKKWPELLKKYAEDNDVISIINTLKWYYEVLCIVVKYYEKTGPLMHEYRALLHDLLNTNTQLVQKLNSYEEASVK
jgi:hypothetical protein